MSTWINRYAPEDIGSGTTITGDKPGHKIAAAITEIQEKAVTEAASDIEDLTLEVADGKVTLGGEITDGLPDGGEQYQVLQRDSSGEAVWDWVRAH